VIYHIISTVPSSAVLQHNISSLICYIMVQ